MRTAFRAGWILTFLCTFAFAQKSSVVTIAGGYQGNHKPALLASFAYPSAVAFDAAGNLYVGDSYNCEIRKVTAQGVVEVFAGSGICGFSGDGGRATSAMLSGYIGAIVFDGNGNLIFADSGNARIRRVTPQRVISTIAGNGTFGYAGDGGPATLAQLAFPRSIALDNAGDLFIADSDNFVVREVATSGIINTIAGNHTMGSSGDGGPALAAQLGYVQGLAADAHGNLYIGDGFQHVRQVNSAGIISTIAGNGQSGNSGDGGPGTAAALGGITALLLNGPGTLEITTYSSAWSLDLGTDAIHLLAGSAGVLGFGGDNGPALSADFFYIGGVAVDSNGNLFLADSGDNRVREIAAGSQVVTTVAGGYVGDGHKATEASLDLSPQGGHLTFDQSGNLYVADTANNRIRRVSPKGVITTVAGTGTMGSSGDGGAATAAQLSHPSAVVIDSHGNLFISDAGNGRIRKVDTTGIITSIQLNGIYGSYIFQWGVGMVIDSGDNIYFSDGSTLVWKMDSAGNANIVAGMPWSFGFSGDGGPATQAQVYFPTALTLDPFGNLYICEWLGHRVRKVDGFGIITTVAGTGVQGFAGDGGPATAASLNFPADLITDASGNLYIADAANGRIRLVDTAGIIQTVVGSGGTGYNGENLAPTRVNVYPIGLAFNPTGQLTFSDGSSNRVRQVGR